MEEKSMKNLSKVLLCLLSIALVLACFAACGSTSSVTFNAGENESFVVEVKKGDKVCPPAVDCAEGVYIEGWYDNEQKTGDKFDFDSAVSSDLTLWARFESSVYRASYDLNYPDCVNPQSVEFTKDGNISLAQAPTRIGYRFLGWSEGSGLFAAGSVYNVSESALKDVVFSARWETATVTVEFLDDTGYAFDVRTLPYGSDVLAPAVAPHTYTCYELSGWDVHEDDMRGVTEDMTINAVYRYLETDASLFDFELTEDKKSYALTGVAGELPAQVALPAYFNGLPVTEIGCEAILYQSFTKLHIPSTYRVIRPIGIYQCRSMETLEIEEGLERLETVSIASAYVLKNVTLPASLNYFGENTFYRCYELGAGNLEVAEGSEHFRMKDDGKWLSNLDGDRLYWANFSKLGANVVIGDEITYLHSGLFCDDNLLQSITINCDLEFLGVGTFYNTPALNTVSLKGEIGYIFGFTDVFDENFYTWLTDLEREQIMYYGAFERSGVTSISLPDGLRYVGPAVFSGCYSLTSISFPETLEKVADDFLNDRITPVMTMRGAGGNDWFDVDKALIAKGCAEDGGDKLIKFAARGIERYTVPSSVSVLAPFAFASSDVKQVDFSQSAVTTLPAGCFSYSKVEALDLTGVTCLLSDGLPEWDGMPFWGRTEIWGDAPAIVGCENLTVLENYGALTFVGNGMFSGTGLTSFEIGADMQMGEFCFSYCNSLEAINVADGHKALSSVDGVLFDKNKETLKIYPAAKKGAAYTVPASVVIVSDGAFLNQRHLENVTFAEDSACVSLGYSAFLRMAKLKTITLPASLESMGAASLGYNHSLEKIEFLSADMPEVLDDYDNEWFKMQPQSENPDEWVEPVFYSNVTIAVPDGRFKAYFNALYAMAPEIAAALDDSLQTKYNYVFDSKGGSQIQSVNGFAALTRPVPNRDGYYFWGWYLSDGTVAGSSWGDEVTFPYWYEGTGSEVTLFARWETERKQDGMSVDTGWDFSESKTITVTESGYYFFRFTAVESGKLRADANDVPLISAELEAAGAEYRIGVMLFSDPSMDYEFIVSRDDRTVVKGHTYYGTLEIGLSDDMLPFTFTASVEII